MSKTPPTFTLGKSILSLVNLVTLIGPFLADWNETHIYNPDWPPHARYHNGQTMTLGLFTGLITFWVLGVVVPSPSSSLEMQKVHLNWVVVLQNMMYLSSLSGILYPGAAWMDPKFGEGRPQLYLFGGLVVVVWVGWGVEMRRLRGVARGGGKVV
ncbi:hypothetical protein M3J09_002821 [Ascochyta lentis]